MYHYKSKERQMKEFIVSKFYDLPQFNGSITTLAGPQLKRVVDLASNLNPDIINIFETCPKTFEKQVKDKYQYYQGNDKIQLHFDNLLNAPITEFIDADLMKTFKTDGKIIEKLLSKQSQLDTDKVFIGTISLRGNKIQTVHNWLNKLILKYIDKSRIITKFVTQYIEYQDSKGQLIYLKKYLTKHTSKIKSLDVYEYSDKEGPMLTFRIVY